MGIDTKPLSKYLKRVDKNWNECRISDGGEINEKVEYKGGYDRRGNNGEDETREIDRAI